MKLYDTIKILLTEDKDCRNSDKILMWRVWEKAGFVKNGALTRDAFYNPKCPLTESIRRCRQKIQETHPNLDADQSVKNARRKKEAKKGTFIYNEEIKAKNGHWEYNKDTAIWIDD